MKDNLDNFRYIICLLILMIFYHKNYYAIYELFWLCFATGTWNLFPIFSSDYSQTYFKSHDLFPPFPKKFPDYFPFLDIFFSLLDLVSRYPYSELPNFFWMSGGSTWARQSPEPWAQPPVSSVSVPAPSRGSSCPWSLWSPFLVDLSSVGSETSCPQRRHQSSWSCLCLAQKQKKQEAELKARGTVWLK